MTKPPPPQPKRPAFAVPKQSPIVLRVLLYAVEGWGKTTLAAHMPSPVMLTAPGEDGYYTLLNAGRVPAVPAHKCESWTDVVPAINEAGGQYGTIVLDSAGAFEQLAREHITKTSFGGDLKDFDAYGRGYNILGQEWVSLLAALDRAHAKGTHVVVLGHSRVQKFQNPMGADFDRYECAIHKQTYAPTAKWADVVLFGKFDEFVELAKGEKLKNQAERKGKGFGGVDRVIYTARRDAYDAKNRLGLPEAIAIPDDPSQSWSSIAQHIPNLKDLA